MRKHLLALIAISLFTATTFVHANGDSAQMRNFENRLNALEQRRGASGVINPPGRPQVRDGVDLFLYGQLLVWNAHENGLAFAVVNHGSSSDLSDAKVRTVHSRWEPAFRVGIGYNMPHDGWDINFTWMRYYSNGHKHVHQSSNNYVFPTHVPPTDPLASVSTATKACSHWRLHLNQLDLDFGREFFVSKWLTLRPHFGLRSDWVEQKWNSKFNNFSFSPTPNHVKLNLRDSWWGIGLEGGLDAQWGLGRGFSIFGDIAGAILYGFHSIHFVDKDSFATGGSSEFANLKNSYRVSHPIFDLMLGLRYDHMFYNDRFHLGLEIGWEHHVYFSQNQFPVFVDDVAIGNFVSNQGDLTLQGWTFGARFDF